MSRADEEARLSARAAALLEDELLVRAFADLEARWLAAWRSSPSRDADGRERVWHMLKALDALRGELRAAVDAGAVALANAEAALRERRAAD